MSGWREVRAKAATHIRHIACRQTNFFYVVLTELECGSVVCRARYANQNIIVQTGFDSEISKCWLRCDWFICRLSIEQYFCDIISSHLCIYCMAFGCGGRSPSTKSVWIIFFFINKIEYIHNHHQNRTALSTFAIQHLCGFFSIQGKANCVRFTLKYIHIKQRLLLLLFTSWIILFLRSDFGLKLPNALCLHCVVRVRFVYRGKFTRTWPKDPY